MTIEAIWWKMRGCLFLGERRLAKCYNRRFAPVCFVNSLPKAGTHLLTNVMNLFPGLSSLPFPYAQLTDLGRSFTGPRQELIPFGVDHPHARAPHAEVRHVLMTLRRGAYTGAHIPFSEEMAKLFAERHIRMVSIIRDPRDVVVSHAQFIARRPPERRLSAYYQTLSESEQIMISILGIVDKQRKLFMANIKERLESILQWESQSYHYLTTFERLVGPQGGGALDVQLQEIRAIAEHLGIRCPEQETVVIAKKAFGDSTTFFKGTIGRWKELFTEEHKQALKELVGQQLIDLGYEKDLYW